MSNVSQLRRRGSLKQPDASQWMLDMMAYRTEEQKILSQVSPTRPARGCR
jgi:hypothetical protein